MRIPWFIYIPLSIITLIGLLWLGAHDHNFVTEPTPKELADSTLTWKNKHPALPPKKNLTPPTVVNTPKLPNQPAATPKIPTGELDLSPALDHYIQNAPLGAAPLINLAQRLEAANAPNFALLAWERTLDNTQPTPEQHLLASDAIYRLHPETPIWNPDPSASLPVVLHIRLPLETKKILSAQIEKITSDLQKASSYQIAPQILLTNAPERSGFPPPPISLWLSGTGENAPETPKLTFSFKPEEGATEKAISLALRNKLYTALYRTITSRLKQQTQLTPPPTLLPDTSPKTALTSHITRLHWHKLAHSLQIAENGQ